MVGKSWLMASERFLIWSESLVKSNYSVRGSWLRAGKVRVRGACRLENA
jgi:hypothetical protein